MKRPLLCRLTLSLLATLAASAPSAAVAQGAAEPVEEAPPIDGYQQILKRGGIPALVDPDFVSADEAEIPDDAWVLGFVFEGEAYAYDLNLLNHHEVVNHRIGDTPVAAVW